MCASRFDLPLGAIHRIERQPEKSKQLQYPVEAPGPLSVY